MIVRPLFPSVAGTVALGLFALGCATAGGPSYPAGQCNILMPGALGISATLLELAPGESVQLERPMMFTAPYAPPDSIPADCAVRWSASAGATINQSGLLTVARDAVPGSRVTVHARVDSLVAEADIQVVDPAPNPLAGTWTQSDPPTCEQGYRPGDAIVRELIFRRGRTFTVTRMPFESYRDYWGTYTYDVATGRLELTVENGNSLPGFKTAAMTARVMNGELVLDGPALVGSLSASAEGCRTVFSRRGDLR